MEEMFDLKKDMETLDSLVQDAVKQSKEDDEFKEYLKSDVEFWRNKYFELLEMYCRDEFGI